MSVDLGAVLVRAISLERLTAAAGTELMNLLGLKALPQLGVRGRYGVVTVLGPETREQLLCSIENEPEVVAIGVIHGEVDPEAYFNVATCRTPLEYALALALAITVARANRGVVSDDAMFYVKEMSNAADDLSRSLRVASGKSDLREAAQAFYEGLYKAGYA